MCRSISHMTISDCSAAHSAARGDSAWGPPVATWPSPPRLGRASHSMGVGESVASCISSVALRCISPEDSIGAFGRDGATVAEAELLALVVCRLIPPRSPTACDRGVKRLLLSEGPPSDNLRDLEGDPPRARRSAPAPGLRTTTPRDVRAIEPLSERNATRCWRTSSCRAVRRATCSLALRLAVAPEVTMMARMTLVTRRMNAVYTSNTPKSVPAVRVTVMIRAAAPKASATRATAEVKICSRIW
mmetsp:Transcript_15750/g.59716  ORF Transcript_15750/g.59716 Transcript_15750/m.59716 type:complete len:245 (+) Transcript_15750:296-1030(+)